MEVTKITSTDNETYKFLRKLLQKKYRSRFSLCILEGEKIIADNIAQVTHVFRSDSNFNAKIHPSIKCYELPEKLMREVSSAVSPAPMIAICKIPNERNFATPFIVLDGIQDAGNVGAILRSASAFGFGTVICLHCADVWSPKVIRSAVGAQFSLSIVEMSTENFCTYIKNNSNIKLITADFGADLNKAREVVTRIKNNFGIVFGNEGQGVSAEIRALNPIIATIPITRNIESLNVSVAAGILMFEFSRLIKGDVK